MAGKAAKRIYNSARWPIVRHEVLERAKWQFGAATAVAGTNSESRRVKWLRRPPLRSGPPDNSARLDCGSERT